MSLIAAIIVTLLFFVGIPAVIVAQFIVVGLWHQMKLCVVKVIR